MTDYNSNTVAQLKDLLKEKSLSLDGKKAELVQRLVDYDNQQASEAAESVTEPVAEADGETIAEDVASADSAVGTVAEESGEPADDKDESTLTVIQPAKKEEPKVLTPEERKQLAIELLNKKIQRAEKFGDEAAAETARKDLVRVEKFGVEPGTALAREIGIVDRELGNKKFNNRRRRFSNNGKNHRGFKNRNSNNKRRN
ncbi:uncharacterized protein RJT21DRAFT_13692 [Scheffersomyces amazonensis]|uniref:uncharacterized protein n=1 Tax=Scheffersomyces amazonensis TaxID=1078765 RepID=UPI00315CA907